MTGKAGGLAAIRSLRHRVREAFGSDPARYEVDPAVFRDRRIVIVGPASTVLDDLEGCHVDGYDVVVRLNGGMALAARNPARLGSRTDVIVHNLNEQGPRAAGTLDAATLRLHGYPLCLFPRWTQRGIARRFLRKRRELARDPAARLLMIPRDIYRAMQDRMGPLDPTVGAVAILFFLECEPAEVAVHGFTFFTTPYADGYNDDVRDGREAAAWARAAGEHDPDRERRVVGEALEKARRRGLTVTLGRNVAKSLEAG